MTASSRRCRRPRYIDVGEELGFRAPDEVGNSTLQELTDLAERPHASDLDAFNDVREQFRRLLIERLTSARRGDDRVIVPTNSLSIECLVGTHPLLEGFKPIHRALNGRDTIVVGPDD